MRAFAYTDIFQVLLLQLADEGRDVALLGGGAERARSACLPFLIGTAFPDLYFEFPLAGNPLLDVTVLYNKLEAGARVRSDAAANTGGMLDWFAGACKTCDHISMGFELDTSKPELPRAGIHFQPRTHLELVEPFFAAVGEPERARLYLDLAARMPKGWPLSFFGMFRGRPGSPLRVCGYMDKAEKEACAEEPAHLAAAFDAIGFTAYSDAMLAEVGAIMGAAPGPTDFQFDVFPDGRIGSVFAVDVQFGLKQPASVRASFSDGSTARLLDLLQDRGVVDERRNLAAGASFARALPIEREDGTSAKCSFTLLPQWLKVRWTDGVLQPAKLYYLGSSELM